MSGRVAVHTALTPQQRAALRGRESGRSPPTVRAPLVAYAVQREVRGRGAAGPYLSGYLHTSIRHALQTAIAKERAREELIRRGGDPLVITEVRNGRDDATGR